MKRIVCILSLSFGCALSLQAQDSVTAKGGKVYAVTGDQQTEIADSLKFPSAVVISNDCTFTVGKGKERKLGEGQVLLRDGWLISPGGSVQPVFDHVFMQAGRVLVIRDGRAEPLSQSLDFPNSTGISPDGYYSYPGGRRARLLDGEWFHLDGTAIPTKDAVTLINGHVVMQKDGSLIPLQPVQVMGMNDGTRVRGDGTIEKFNGPTIKLREGQTILIDGPNIKR